MARQVRCDSYLYILPCSNFERAKVTRWYCGSFNRMLSNLTSTCFGQILNIIIISWIITNQRVLIASLKLLKGPLESIASHSKHCRTLSKQSSLDPCIAMVPFFDGVVAKEFAMASYLIPNLQHRIRALRLVLCGTLRQQTHEPSERDHLFAGSLMLTSLTKKFEMGTIHESKSKHQSSCLCLCNWTRKDSAWGSTQKHQVHQVSNSWADLMALRVVLYYPHRDLPLCNCCHTEQQLRAKGLCHGIAP